MCEERQSDVLSAFLIPDSLTTLKIQIEGKCKINNWFFYYHAKWIITELQLAVWTAVRWIPSSRNRESVQSGCALVTCSLFKTESAKWWKRLLTPHHTPQRSNRMQITLFSPFPWVFPASYQDDSNFCISFSQSNYHLSTINSYQLLYSFKKAPNREKRKVTHGLVGYVPGCILYERRTDCASISAVRFLRLSLAEDGLNK